MKKSGRGWKFFESLYKHIPGNYSLASSYFLLENALTMNLALCTSASLFHIFNFTAFETVGSDIKTELTERENNFQKG